MFNRHSLLAGSILLFIYLLGEFHDFPIRNLVPYALAVGLMTWHAGVIVGFIFSGIAVLIALEIDAFPWRVEASGLMIYEFIYAYMKLSAVVLGVWLGKNWRAIKQK